MIYGKIYMLISASAPGRIYYGSTEETLAVRFSKHKHDYKRWLNGTYHYITAFELLQYEDCQIILIEDYLCETKKQLRKHEGHYILNNLCVNKYVAGGKINQK